MPSQTITSTSSGVTLTPGGYSSPVTVVSGAVVTGPQIGIYAATDWSILNLGTVTGTSSVGVFLKSGGTLVNGQSGSTIDAAYISGPEAISIQGAAGFVSNYGTIAGTFD